MAHTVVVFRDNMIERERLAAVQGETNAAREERAEAIAAMIRGVPQLGRAGARAPAQLRRPAGKCLERAQRRG